MKRLNLKFTNVGKTDPTILVDGKAIKAKKNEFGNYVYLYQTEKDSVNIVVKRYLELASRHWLWMGILFLVISVFGIFDKRYSKSCATYDCELNISLVNDTTNFEGKLSSGENGNAIEYKCDGEVLEISNRVENNPKLKKRRKILLAIRIVMIIALVVTLAGVLISEFIGG